MIKIPPFFSGRLLYPLIDRMSGRQTINIVQQLEASQWLPTQRHIQIQWQALQQLVEHANLYVPYYKKIFNQLGCRPGDIHTPRDFCRLPVLTKEIVRANLSDLVDQRLDVKTLYQSATGGSTGVPMPYYHDSYHGQYSNAITIRNNRWSGWNLGDPLLYLWGANFDLNLATSLKGRWRDLVDNRLVLSAWDLGEAKLEEYYNLTKQFRPKLVVGYANALYLFSSFLVSRKARLQPLAVISSAETLFDYQREVMEQAFACPVLDRYGCREVGNIAHECPEAGGMHINAEMIYVEIIKDNQPCAPGELGEIVVTCLTNKSMPIIRYAIGDLGALGAGSCGCGRGLPLLQSLQGRIQDVLISTTGQYVTGELFPHLLKEFINILEYQIIQENKKVIILNLVVKSPLTSIERQKIERVVQKYLGSDMMIQWNYLDAIAPPASGKHRSVISQVPINIGGFRQHDCIP